MNDLAVPHDGDAVADLQGLVQVVGYENDGLVQLSLQPYQFVLHVAADQGVQPAEWLVHKQDVGVHGQGPGQADPLLHAAAELPGIGILPAGKTHQVQHLLGSGVAAGLVHAPQLQAPGRVVYYPAVGQQTVVLENHGNFIAADVGQLSVVVLQYVLAVYEDLAGCGLDQPYQAADQGGLAASGKTHDNEGLPTPDVEAGVLQCNDAPQLG